MTHHADGKVLGLRAFPLADQPPALPLLFYALRIMVLIGFAVTGFFDSLGIAKAACGPKTSRQHFLLRVFRGKVRTEKHDYE